MKMLQASESSSSDGESLEVTGCECCGLCREADDVAARKVGMDAHWAEPGQMGSHSHDHSPHVTDEVFNAASHLMAGMLSVLGTAVVIVGASAHGNPWAIVAFSVYGASLCLLFFARETYEKLAEIGLHGDLLLDPWDRDALLLSVPHKHMARMDLLWCLLGPSSVWCCDDNLPP